MTVIPPHRHNYRRMMDEMLSGLEGTPALLLHSCCAPCSSSVIAALSSFFAITVFYFNPNIDERDEYEKRKREQKRLVATMPTPNPVRFLEGDYDPEVFLSGARDLAGEPEGGARCAFCFSLRLETAARTAREAGIDYYTTTLSLSPLKDAERINAIGKSMGERYRVEWVWSDFKKKDGYRKSIELSKEYGLYRQDYCGCSFSRRASSD